MPKQLSPQEKKRLSYEKDHIDRAESQQAFRKTWPLIKAWSKRDERRKVRRLLTDVMESESEDQQGDLAQKPVRRQQVQKRHGVHQLAEDLEFRLAHRGRRALRRIFKQPYDAE